MQNKAIFYFHFDIFIFENKVAGDKMQLNGQFALYPATMECPDKANFYCKRSVFIRRLLVMYM